MLVLKCLGAGAVAAGCFLLGRAYKRELSGRELLDGRLERGLRFLEGRIALSEKMLSDVMGECSEKFFEGSEDNVFGNFSKRLAKGQALESAWKESVGEMKLSGGEVPKREQECLMRLEGAFALSDVERYSGSFNMAAEEMKTFREEAEVKRAKEGDLAMKLMICGAAAMIMLLW